MTCRFQWSGPIVPGRSLWREISWIKNWAVCSSFKSRNSKYPEESACWSFFLLALRSHENRQDILGAFLVAPPILRIQRRRYRLDTHSTVFGPPLTGWVDAIYRKTSARSNAAAKHVSNANLLHECHGKIQHLMNFVSYIWLWENHSGWWGEEGDHIYWKQRQPPHIICLRFYSYKQ